MANLKALREKIKNITDYSPDLQEYNDQLDELINDAYFSLWTEKRWTFGFKQYLFKFIPDMLPTRDVIAPVVSINANVQKGSRRVTFSNSMDRLTKVNFEGQFIEIQGYEYTISKVVSDQELLLDKQFHGTTNTDDVSWIIKRRFYDLPHDCIELLNLSHRDVPNSNGGSGRFPPYGKLIALPARKDEQLNLRMDYKAAYAEAFVWSDPLYVPEAFKCELTRADDETDNGFPPSTSLEVCWAFVRDGKVGALSDPATISFPNAEHSQLTIKFKSFDDQDVVADAFQSKDVRPSQFEGLDKMVFWNSNFNRTTGERIGLPKWRVFTQGGGTRNTTTYLDPVIAADTASSVTITNFNQIDPGNDAYIEYDGLYQRIRPYPRVDAWDEEVTQFVPNPQQPDQPSKLFQDFLREGVARYYFKPAALTFATDSPEMPNVFHQLIVYKVLETLYDKTGSLNNAQSYRQRYEREIKRLEKRFCDHIDSLVQRGQFQLGGNRFFYYDYASLKTGG